MPDLISIGLVTRDGAEFYGERSDFDIATCSDFVKDKRSSPEAMVSAAQQAIGNRKTGRRKIVRMVEIRLYVMAPKKAAFNSSGPLHWCRYI